MTTQGAGHGRPDIGAETFERFHYQASVAIPFCIDVAGGRLRAIYAEHEEDLAVQQLDDCWRFIQIKTRDAHLGPWRFSDLVGQKGALRSLLRTYKKVRDLCCTLEVFLEGGLAKDKPFQEIANGGPLSNETINEVASKLKATAEEATAFLGQVRIVGGLPSRETIESKNLDLLGRGAPGTAHDAIARTNARLTAAILAAMRSPRSGLSYPASILSIATSSGQKLARLHAKRLDIDNVLPLLAELETPAFPLLITSPGDYPYSSKLALKLRSAGATDAIVAAAQDLRANATRREFELLSLEPDSKALMDVRQRLKAESVGLIARHSSAAKPAVEIWDDLLGRLTARATTCDPRSIFYQDPHLLLGEVAELTDMCEIEWRQPE